MKKFPFEAIVTASLLIVLSQSAFAEKKAKPKTMSGASATMIANTCAGCHGTYGASNGPSIPILGGMSAVYLVEMMEAFKADDIPSTIMGRLAKGYTTEEFERMGEYFAKQKFVAATGQKSDIKKAKKGAKIHDKYCEKCHSEQGTLAYDDSGFLKGQWKSYLSAQLKDFHSKDRQASKKMAKKMKKMLKKEGSAGLEALLEFYSK